MRRILLQRKNGTGSSFGKQSLKFIFGIATPDDQAAPEEAQILVQHPQATQQEGQSFPVHIGSI
jgi:hypothetical protein